MKKINITIAMLLALALVFAGCRGEGGEDTTAPPTETTLPETTDEEVTSAPVIEYNGSRGLLYEIAEDGKSAYLSGIGSCTDADITVASLYDDLPVTAIGKSAFYNQQQIKSITVPESVERIEEGAFSNCKGLKSIVLHDGITFIGESAFEYCVSLMSISLPKGLTRLETGVLASCKDLAEIEIPESVTEIAPGAFVGCTLLETVKIPSNVKKISNLAFSQCRLLTAIDFNGTSEEWASVEKEMGWDYESTILSVRCSDGEIDPIGSIGLEFRTFADYAVVVGIGTCKDSEVIIPARYNGLPVTEIWDRAFFEVKGMTSVTIPEGVTYIESEAFLNCPDLREIHLPASLENVTGSLSIGFMNCPALEFIEVAEGNAKYYVADNCLIEKATGKLILAGGNAVIPADGSVKSIGAHAFAGNLLLKSISIPEGVTDIHTSAFEGCTKLASVTLPTTLKTVRQSAFKGCSALTSIVIPDSVTEIYNAAFSDCKKLKNVTLSKNLSLIDSEAFKACAVENIVIPAGVTELCAAFSECQKLKSVILPEGFERFVGHTFAGCTSLESINLPASLKYIGMYTFKDCTALKSVTIPANVSNFGDYAFAGCSGLQSVTLMSGLKLNGAHIFGDTKLMNIKFTGTVAEWNAVERDPLWNEGITATVVYCKDGTSDINPHNGTPGLWYKIDPDGKTAALVSMGNAASSDIVIASEYNGCPVTVIATGAFDIYPDKGTLNPTSIKIPDSVEYIATDSFIQCFALKELYIPASVKQIDELAFRYMPGLTSITVDPKNERYYGDNCIIDKETGALILGCGATKLPTDGSLRSIALYAFAYCEKLESIALPEGLTTVGESAFAYCLNLASVSFPESLTDIQGSAFWGCKKLKEVILPESVTVLSSGAFHECAKLERVKLGSKVSGIQRSAFYGCSSLKSITLPKTLTYIGAEAFGSCTNLSDIVFEGTAAEWNAIERGDLWNYKTPYTSIRCSDGIADILEITEAEALEKAAEYWRIMYGIKDGDPTPDSPAGTKYKMVVTELPSESSPCYKAELQAVGISTKLLDKLNIDAKTGDVVLHADASARFYDILRGFEAKFFNVSGGYLAGQSVTLDEYCDAVWGKMQIFYTELDLDGDGVTELVIHDSALKQATLVLHEENGVMYGFTFAEKAFDRLKTDGTFIYEAYPESGNKYEYYAAKLEFSGSDVKTEKLFGTYVDPSDVYHYYNGNKAITKDDVDTLWDIQNAKELPDWSPLGRWYLKTDIIP